MLNNNLWDQSLWKCSYIAHIALQQPWKYVQYIMYGCSKLQLNSAGKCNHNSPRLGLWHYCRHRAASPGPVGPQWGPGSCCAVQQLHRATSLAMLPDCGCRSPLPSAGPLAKAFPLPPAEAPAWRPNCAAASTATPHTLHRPSGTHSSGATPTQSDCVWDQNNDHQLRLPFVCVSWNRDTVKGQIQIDFIASILVVTNYVQMQLIYYDP